MERNEDRDVQNEWKVGDKQLNKSSTCRQPVSTICGLFPNGTRFGLTLVKTPSFCKKTDSCTENDFVENRKRAENELWKELEERYCNSGNMI